MLQVPSFRDKETRIARTVEIVAQEAKGVVALAGVAGDKVGVVGVGL